MQSVTLVKEGGLVGHFQLQQPTGARAVEPLSQGTPRRRGSERGQLSHTQSHFNSTVSQGKVLETRAHRQRGLGCHCTEKGHTSTQDKQDQNVGSEDAGAGGRIDSIPPKAATSAQDKLRKNCQWRKNLNSIRQPAYIVVAGDMETACGRIK